MRSSTKKTSNASKSIPKSTTQKNTLASKPGGAMANKNAPPKYKIDAITKDNFDLSGKKENIT